MIRVYLDEEVDILGKNSQRLWTCPADQAVEWIAQNSAEVVAVRYADEFKPVRRTVAEFLKDMNNAVHSDVARETENRADYESFITRKNR